MLQRLPTIRQWGFPDLTSSCLDGFLPSRLWRRERLCLFRNGVGVDEFSDFKACSGQSRCLARRVRFSLSAARQGDEAHYQSDRGKGFERFVRRNRSACSGTEAWHTSPGSFGQVGTEGFDRCRLSVGDGDQDRQCPDSQRSGWQACKDARGGESDLTAIRHLFVFRPALAGFFITAIFLGLPMCGNASYERHQA